MGCVSGMSDWCCRGIRQSEVLTPLPRAAMPICTGILSGKEISRCRQADCRFTGVYAAFARVLRRLFATLEETFTSRKHLACVDHIAVPPGNWSPPLFVATRLAPVNADSM